MASLKAPIFEVDDVLFAYPHESSWRGRFRRFCVPKRFNPARESSGGGRRAGDTSAGRRIERPAYAGKIDACVALTAHPDERRLVATDKGLIGDRRKPTAGRRRDSSSRRGA